MSASRGTAAISPEPPLEPPSSFTHPHSVHAVACAALPALLFSFAAGVVCYSAVGATTGLFFGSVAIVALLTPPLVAHYSDRVRQLVVASSVVDGVAIVLLFATTDPYVTLLDWVRAYLLLAAFGAALWGVAFRLTRLRVAPVFASAITVVLALAWLAWPVWLSPWIAGKDRLVAWLVAAHPLFGLDGTLRHLGPPWTERHLMYTKLTVLNQDVFYALPRGVGRAVLFHAAVAIACLVSISAVRRTTTRSPADTPPSSPPPAGS